MGNALDFLDRKAAGQQRKGHHNKVCKEKTDEWLKENDPTKCPDFKYIQSGAREEGHKVNTRFAYMGSVPGINARRYAKRKPKPCECCEELFVPVKMRRKFTQSEKDERSDSSDSRLRAFCPACTKLGSEYRGIVSKVGGIDKYVDIKIKIDSYPASKHKSTLFDLFEELDLRILIHLEYKKILNAIGHIEEAAAEENKMYDVRHSHYEFDF